jgi:WD40 repeat protein
VSQAAWRGSVVRVLQAGSSTPAGVGFVVGERHILTCAHVVNAALNRKQRTQEAPGLTVRVQVDFPILGNPEGPSRNCRVEAWAPPPEVGIIDGDVAGLVIIGDELPQGAVPARLTEATGFNNAVANVFGYPAEPPRGDGAWVTVQLRGPVGGEMIQLDLSPGAAMRVQPGYSGSPVIVASDGVGDAVVGMVAGTGRDSDSPDAYAISVTQLVKAWPEVLGTLTVPACPYRSLEPFRAEDADAGLFVGREDDTDRLHRMVNEHGLVMIVGPSGVGKSSLVDAGLLPALRHSGEWATASLRPGKAPFKALAMALYDLEAADPGPSLDDLTHRGEQLRDGGLTELIDTLRVLLKGRRILLHVDQFEEVFTICPDGERDSFLKEILSVVGADDGASRLVCTLRADFVGQVLNHPEFGFRLQHRLLPISAMGPDALERAVTEPARTCGVTYDEGLAGQIAHDAAGGDGGLPLMQFALTELWPRQRQRRLRFADYHDFGGVTGALNRYAEAVFAALTPNWPEEQIRRVMLACVRSRSGAALATRCTIRRDSFAVPGDWELIKHLVDQRLLLSGTDSADRSATVELAHESLIRSWARFTAWVDDDAEFRRWLTIMIERVEENEPLHDEARIREAERWLAERLDDIPPSVRELVERSGILFRQRIAELEEARRRAEEALHRSEKDRRAAKEAQHRAEEAQRTAEEALRRVREGIRQRRQLLLIVVVLLVVVAGVAGFGISRQSTVAQQRVEALSRKVAEEADRAGASDPSLAMQLSVAAYRIKPTLEARSSLLRASTLHAATRVLGNASAFKAVAIRPDGRTLAAGSADQMVRLYDITDLQQPTVVSSLTDHIGAITGVTFSPDGRTLASSSRDNTVRLWDLTDLHRPALLSILTDHAPAVTVNAVAFSADGHLLASGSSDHRVRLWDIGDPRHPAGPTLLKGHDSSVDTVAFSPDGHTLASAGDDRTVRLWDLADPRHTSATLAGHTDNVYAVAFSPDGRTLASGSRDRSVRLWDLTDTHHLTEPAMLTGPVSVESVAFSSDGRSLASGNQDGRVRLWDLTKPQPTESAPLTGHTTMVGAVAFNSDRHILATGSDDGTVRLWILTDPRHVPVVLTGSLHTPLNPGNQLDTVALSPDGHTLASGGSDQIARLWDLSDPRHPALSASLPALPRFIESVAFNLDGRTLAIADGDHTTRLWDITDRHQPTELAVLRGHTSVVESAIFSPDGHTLASASSDGTIRLWNVTDRHQPTELAVLRGHTSAVEWVAFSPDGHTLASAGHDNTIRLWDLTDPQHASTALEGHTDTVEMVAFSPDGHTLASGSRDGTVRLWDLTDLHHPTEASSPLTGHTANVEAVAFSPDGHTLASGSFDGTMRLWDLTDPDHPAVILTGHTNEVEAVAFTPDGHTLASGGSDGTIRLWETDPEQTVKDICALIVTPLPKGQLQQYIPGGSDRLPCASR